MREILANSPYNAIAYKQVLVQYQWEYNTYNAKIPFCFGNFS